MLATAVLTTSEQAAYWVIPVIRAVPALVIGLVITFMADHSSRVGLIAFGVFALLTGVVVAYGSARILTDRALRGVFITHGTIAAVCGIAAIALWNAGIGVLLLIITVYTALTGALELYAGLRARAAAPSRDWILVGAFTAVAAIVFVLINPDSILVTGLIGSYAMVLGVFLIIAGLSLKWANTAPVDSAVPIDSVELPDAAINSASDDNTATRKETI